MAMHLIFFLSNLVASIALLVVRIYCKDMANYDIYVNIAGIVCCLTELGVQLFIAYLMIKFSFPS